jgi:hypothetical protein
VSRDPWPFSLAGADGDSGCRRAWHHPPASEAGPRWFESSHPDCKRKGKPTGDGTRPEPGRATSLEGSTPSPSAERNVPVAERPRHRSSKPDRRVQLPPGTLTDGSLTTRRTTGPVGNRQTTLAQNEGCWGFNSPLGHSYALADQPGVVATPSPWRAWVQIPSRVLTRRVGWAPASPSGCNPPASAVQVQLLPDTLTGLVAQPAEQDSLKVEVQGSTPCGATGSILGVSSNGKTVGLHPADEGSTPSTVHCEWPGGGTGRHAVLRRPCPPRREGSSPSLVTAHLCPVLRTQAPALRRLVGQFDSGMGYWGLSRGFRAPGLRSPVGRFDSCTTYWISNVPAGNE